MSEKSGIEWTHATWNPTTGCTKVSPGCLNCYAEKLSYRLYRMGVEKYKNNFKLTIHEDSLEIPLKWQEPKLIFVNSMSDLFHKDVPFAFVKRVFEVMEEANWHCYQILTKRPERMLEFTQKYYQKPLSNVWLGTSVESAAWKGRIDILRKVPARVRFLSIEPLIGQVGELNLKNIHWVIAGGESGPNRRPVDKEWVREIRDQCIDQKVAFFFKQWGGYHPKANGRRLDRKHWNEYPVKMNYA
ncbi:MAG: phage Gp37/Gp68 family protein [Ignavibacteriae bacterium]|nr:phage Gp37/Gp68 family protein [Ignavibacteriota bacterium]